MSLTTLVKDSDFTPYAVGTTVLSNKQLFNYNNTLYFFSGTVPHTISNSVPTSDSANWVSLGAGDATLRSDLNDVTKGSRLIQTNVDQFTHTVTRTQYDKNRDVFSVRDYGAVGDGVTDDTAAITAAQADGCRFYPPGVYKVTNVNCVLNMRGTSGEGTILYNSVSYPAKEYLTDSITLNVPSVFPDIPTALNWAKQKRLADTCWLTIKIADGTYNIKNIYPQVKDWERFQIIGNTSNPGNVILLVDTTSNGSGFIFEYGYGCSYLGGFTLRGTTGGSGGWQSDGVWASQTYGAGVKAVGSGSSVYCYALNIEYIYYGYQARYGAYIYCPNTAVNYAGDCCYHAFQATIYAYNCTATHARHTNGENLGFGFCAESSGFIECEHSNASYCQVGGFYSLGNASMWAHACESHNNFGHGFYALNGGYLEGNGLATDRYSNAYSNAGNGFYALNGGIMQTNLSYANNTGTNYLASNGGIILT